MKKKLTNILRDPVHRLVRGSVSRTSLKSEVIQSLTPFQDDFDIDGLTEDWRQQLEESFAVALETHYGEHFSGSWEGGLLYLTMPSDKDPEDLDWDILRHHIEHMIDFPALMEKYDNSLEEMV